jgi:hypothetical protein
MMDAAAAAHFEERERETEREEYKESPFKSSILLRRSRNVEFRYNGEKKRINVVLSSQPTRAL